MLKRCPKHLCREQVGAEQDAQDDVLHECLHVREMDRFAEAAAVHLRVEDEQQQGQQREESLKGECGNSGEFSPHSCYEGCSDYGFKQCESYTEGLRCESKELQVEEIKIFGHYQTRPYWVHQLEQASYEEDEACNESAETL